MSSKRSSSTAFPEESAKRRVHPTAMNGTSFCVTNLQDNETVYQASLLLTGTCPHYGNSSSDYISIKRIDAFKDASHLCNWPIANGQWKALVLLDCGQNELAIEWHHAGGIAKTMSISVVYQPLLQVPPLLLTILVAKDSPLLIDCPPAKYGAVSSAHNGLDAVVAKFRTTALMWQALTAEDMRAKGLGRRSFRLEEEWSTDTTLLNGSRGANGGTTQMTSVPKIHIIRSEHTTAELRDPRCAQQNRNASRDQWLHQTYTQALKKHGSPFDSSCRPVVAGLILDSQYSVEQSLILGHAALGCHDPNGISLGIFGSHLTYSWPRFLDEVTACLTDATVPGDSVGNDNNECNTLASACFVGQGAFLHEVGHAFGADHTTGIMARGYSKDWPYNFIPQSHSKHEAKWDIQDALRFMLKPHFRLPGDEPITSAFVHAEIRVEVSPEEDGESALRVYSSAGLAHVVIHEKTHNLLPRSWPSTSGSCTEFKTTDFASYDRGTPLQVSVLALNGKAKVVGNVWRLFASKPYIEIPGTKTKLRKRSIKPTRDEYDSDEDHDNAWTVMLRKRSTNGTLVRASAIDLRVGCTFDGAVVYYTDGTHQNCGQAEPHEFGGHASEKHDIPKRAKIVKIEIGQRGGWGGLDGIRMTLDNGDVWGELNADSKNDSVEVLEPGADEKIVGFFGRSSPFVQEFGIIIAPKDFKVPDAVYDMRELQNLGDSKMDVDDSSSVGSQSDSQSTLS